MRRPRIVPKSQQPFELEAFVPYLMTQIYHRLNKSFAHALRPLRLDPARWRVLANLARRDRATFTELLQYTALDQPTLSRTVARLVQAGQVARRRKLGDGRAVELSLTAEGRKTWARALEVGMEQYRLSARGMRVSERKQLAAALSRMLDNVSAMTSAESGARRPARRARA